MKDMSLRKHQQASRRDLYTATDCTRDRSDAVTWWRAISNETRNVKRKVEISTLRPYCHQVGTNTRGGLEPPQPTLAMLTRVITVIKLDRFKGPSSTCVIL